MMEEENLIKVPGVPIAPEELKHPNARALARAIEKRPYFTLLECRRYEPAQADSASPTPTYEGTQDARLIIECPEMTPQEIEEVARQVEIGKRASTEGNGDPLSPVWLINPEAPVTLAEQAIQQQICEFVIFEVDTDAGQHPFHPIELTEPLAASFVFDSEATQWSNKPPQTLALRKDFPIVPHLNARSDNGENHLQWLCLWSEPHHEVELKWTPALHLERVNHWLSKTARGQLHAPDQPLEPLFFAAPSYLLVPPSLLELPQGAEQTASDQSFGGSMVKVGQVVTFVANAQQTGRYQIPFATLVLRAEAQTHGVIKHPPQTLQELQEYGQSVGLDVMNALRMQLRQWMAEKALWQAIVVIVLQLPSRRTDQDAPEKQEVYAFTTLKEVKHLGTALKVWEWKGNRPVALAHHNDAGGPTPIYPLNVAPLLERKTAELFNAQEPLGKHPKIVAIGAGAIGSQVFMALARSGWGDWTIVDGDLFLPHNAARHALDGTDLGFSKAGACCQKANSLFDESFRSTPLIASLTGEESPGSPLAQALEASDLVLDFSASVSTARILADAPNPCARRISVFLNPGGTQMLILAEDSARTLTLTDLEMQLWRAIVTDKAWSDYCDDIAGERVRYARSCGDLSARLSQDFVALHSAGASRALRKIARENEAMLLRWTVTGETGEVHRSQWPLSPMQEWEVGDWKVRASEDVMRELWEMRKARLPLETGGILLGVFDNKRKIAHLVAALPAPPDSEECRDSFLRGHQGLREAKEKTEALSGGTVSYLGEWHSHPDGHDATRSVKDYQNFSYLKARCEADGLPPIMLILADKGECNWFVGEMTPPPAPSLLIIRLH